MFRASACLLLVALCLTQNTRAESHGESAVATFNFRGVMGTIEFMEKDDTKEVIITVNLSGTEDLNGWHVHTLPVDMTLDPEIRCSNDQIGGHYDPLMAVEAEGSNYTTACQANSSKCEIGDLSGKFGPIPTQPANYTDTTGLLSLNQRYGIIGRSIKIHGNPGEGADTCATIVSTSQVNDNVLATFLRASFIYPVAGNIYMKQVQGEATRIWGKVYWVTDQVSTTFQHNWHIHVNSPQMEYREGQCGEVGDHFNPYNLDRSSIDYKTTCGPDNIEACEVGDLSNKHAKIDIPVAPEPLAESSFFYTDNFLNLTGVNGVKGRSIAIHAVDGGGPIIACAPLIEVEDLMVSESLGQFSAWASSRYSNTNMKSSLETSRLTLLDSAISPNQLCNVALDSSMVPVYNPYNSSDPDGDDNTPDQYRVGSISEKASFQTSGVIPEFPIHGIDTVAGRSLAYTKGSGESTQYTCSALMPEFPAGAEVMMAKASFSGDLSGAIYFTQQKHSDSVWGTTFITVDVWYASTVNQTEGHKWHVHERPPRTPGQSCSTDIGGHFNPFDVDLTSSQYSTECSPRSPLRCESGDLSGKHGKLSLSPGTASRKTYTFVDPNLNLWGSPNYSIVGRSIGIHLPSSSGGSLFECAEIKPFVKATSDISISVDSSDDFDRTSFVKSLTDRVSDVAPSDVLIVRQESTPQQQDGTIRVDLTLQVLGASVESANAARARLQDVVDPTMSPTTTDGNIVLTYSFWTIVALQCVLAYAY